MYNRKIPCYGSIMDAAFGPRWPLGPAGLIKNDRWRNAYTLLVSILTNSAQMVRDTNSEGGLPQISTEDGTVYFVQVSDKRFV